MIKILHTFEIGKEEEVNKIEETVNENGEKVSITKKIKQNVPHKFFIARPSRSLQEEGELFRARKFSDAVKQGILTHDLLSKRLQNDDGLLSEQEKTKWKAMYENLFKAQNDLQNAYKKPEPERTEEDKEIINKTIKTLKEIRQDIRNFEVSKSSLFDMTAETYARNKVIFWYFIYLSYKAGANGDPEPFFQGKNYNEKLDKYEEIEEKNDPFLNQIAQKFMQYTTLWFISEVSNPEQFALLIKEVEEEDKETEKATKSVPEPAVS